MCDPIFMKVSNSFHTFFPITSSNSDTQGSLESSPRCPLKSDIVAERQHCEYFSSLQIMKTDEHGIVLSQMRNSIRSRTQLPIKANTILPTIKNQYRKAIPKSKVAKTYPRHPMRTRSKSRAMAENTRESGNHRNPENHRPILVWLG